MAGAGHIPWWRRAAGLLCIGAALPFTPFLVVTAVWGSLVSDPPDWGRWREFSGRQWLLVAGAVLLAALSLPLALLGVPAYLLGGLGIRLLDDAADGR